MLRSHRSPNSRVDRSPRLRAILPARRPRQLSPLAQNIQRIGLAQMRKRLKTHLLQPRDDGRAYAFDCEELGAFGGEEWHGGFCSLQEDVA
jgi:hypothetical protein